MRKRNVWALTWLASMALIALAGGVAAARAPREPVTAAAKRFGDAVAARDVARIVQFVDLHGVTCVDSQVPRREVKTELQSPGGWLHDYFFDAAGFRKRYANVVDRSSLAEVVGSPGWRVVVFPEAIDEYPCVYFTRGDGLPTDTHQPMAIICFMWNGRRWVLRELPNCG